MRVVLCAIRQHQPDADRKDDSLAVYRLKAEADARLADAIHTVVRDVEPDQIKALIDELLADPPDLLGLSCYVWSAATLAGLAGRVRAAHPEVTIVAGGPAAAVFLPRPGADQDFALPPVDAVVLGEGEAVLLDMVREVRKGGREGLGRLPGLALPGTQGVRYTDQRRPIARLDRLASPYRSDLLMPRGELLLESARGCASGCAFCSAPAQYPGKVRSFSPEYVAADLEHCLQHGARRAYLLEPTLNQRTGRMRALCEALGRHDPQGRVEWFLEINPALLTRNQLDVLAALPGKKRFAVGLQSIHAEVLRAARRPPVPDNLAESLAALAEIGEPVVEIMLGLPGDTPERFAQTLDFVLEQPGVSTFVFRTLVSPGCELWHRATDLGIEFDPQSFLVQSTPDFSADQLDRVEQDTIARLQEHAGQRPGFRGAFAAGDVRARDFRPSQRDGQEHPLLVSPVASAVEAKTLAEAGADELYCGLAGADGLDSRREMPQANLGSLDELGQVVDAGLPVALALNASFYDDEGTERALALATRAARLGVRALIVADPALLRALHREQPDIALHASAVSGALNRLAVEALADLGASRVILPRHLELDEIAALARRSPVALETFVMDWRCPNFDAFCGFAHERWACEMPSGCCLPYRVSAPAGTDKARLEAVRRELVGREARAAAGCAACDLPRLLGCGVHHLKLVGRRLDPAQRLQNLRYLVAVRKVFEEPDIEQRARELRLSVLDTPCIEGACYYR